VAHEFFGLFLVAIRAVAAGPEFFFAKETFAAADGERDDYAIPLLEFRNGAFQLPPLRPSVRGRECRLFPLLACNDHKGADPIRR
jgi:hypothetical protein